MAKCEHCGYPHALPGHCSDCGSNDPLPSRHLLRLAVIVAAVGIFATIVCIPVLLYLKRAADIRGFPTAPPLSNIDSWFEKKNPDQATAMPPPIFASPARR